MQSTQKVHGTNAFAVSAMSRALELLCREPLRVVDGGQSHRTFVYIKDAIKVVLPSKLYVCFCH
jgi:hypothetical protein